MNHFIGKVSFRVIILGSVDITYDKLMQPVGLRFFIFELENEVVMCALEVR